MDRAADQVLLGAAFAIVWCVLARVAARVFAPVDRSQLLDSAEMARVKCLFVHVERQAGLAMLCVLVALPIPIALVLAWLNNRVIFPMLDGAYDGRRWEWWCGAGFASSLSLAFWIQWRLIRRRTGSRFPLYLQFAATRDRANPEKNVIIWVLMLLLMAVPFGWAAWNNGIVVDQRGITVRLAWYSVRHAYEDVVRIEQFASCSAAAGGTGIPAVRVSFGQGTPVTILENSRCNHSAGIPAIADYVSVRSLVPVSRQSVQPARPGSG